MTGQTSREQSKAAADMLASPEFKRLVSRKWLVSILLTLALFVIYYGYILLVATNKPLMATKIGEATTLGIPLGVGVILGSWVLTAIYVMWANRSYDDEVRRLRNRLGR